MRNDLDELRQAAAKTLTDLEEVSIEGLATEMGPHARLFAAVAGLEPDAVTVVAFVAERLLKGRKAYGDLSLKEDRRDFRKELSEEFADAVVYASCDILREALRK